MKNLINKRIDQLSEFLAYRKGLLPVLGMVLILTNWILQWIASTSWLARTNTFLHVGIIIAIIGFLISWAL